MLVVSRPWKFSRLIEMQFVHVEALSHGVLSCLVVGRSAETLPVLVGARSRHICVAVDILKDLVYVCLLHVLASYAEGE